MKKTSTLIITLIILLIIFGVLFVMDQKNATTDIPTEESNVFENTNYSFSLELPEDWNINVSDSKISPKINIYTSDNIDSPIDTFANKTHLSIYPLGIPTEGVFGQTIPVSESNLDFEYNLSPDSRVYVLESGEPFAAYLKPLPTPEDWGPAGFIWLRLEIENLEITCLRGDEVIPQTECDPLVQGDEIVRNGEVDLNEWQSLQDTLKSLELDQDPKTEDPEITGNWISTQDEKAEVIYKEDGTFEDIYDGETLSSGTWEVYQNELADYNPSGFFLRTQVNGEVFEYAIISLEDNVLQLSYLARGNTLEYKRVSD